MNKAKAWVDKKLREGVHPKELYNCLGLFSNAKKEKKMKEKNSHLLAMISAMNSAITHFAIWKR